MKFSKLSLVLLSCFSFTKRTVAETDTRNIDLSSFFANLLEHQQQTPAPAPVTPNTSTKVAGVIANANEIDDDEKYTQEDIKKYTKFLLNFVNNGNTIPEVASTSTTTAITTTTTAVAATSSASGILSDIKDLSAELDEIKERRVDEIGELIDIIKKVSTRLDALEDTVEQSLVKQEAANTVPETKDVELKNAEDDNAQKITPINENDLKYAAIFNAFNKKNEEKIEAMQQNEIKLLEEIKELLSNNVKAQTNNDEAKENTEKSDKVEKDQDENADKEEENSEKPHVVSINHLKKIISEVASNTTNEQQVDEVQRIIKEIQLNEKAVDVEEKNNEEKIESSVDDALFKVASNTMNDEQVEEVRKFIKAIEAKHIVDDNLKKDEVIRKLIYDIASNSTNENQVQEIQRILGKVQLYNKYNEDKQQEREDNIAFGQEMAAEIVKTPEEISNDLKNLLVNLVNNAHTEEEAANVANIINQIKEHDKLIKEQEEKQQGSADFTKIQNVEKYMIDFDDGSSNQVYLKEDQEFLKPVVQEVEQEVPETQERPYIPVADLEEGTDENGNGKGLFVLGAFGVIALAGVGYTYRSKARKYNDEFPFSDTNLPFSNSMNGLVVDKKFLLRKNSIPKPRHIVNNDAVIRPSQPSWATSILMDENNKKGLKENIQMTEDPEELLDEQLSKIENKEKVIVKSNLPSVVITIDDNDVTTTESPENPKPKKVVKKPKLRRSTSRLALDKKKEEDAEKNRKKAQKKARKSSFSLEKKIAFEKEEEDDDELDEETEKSINTSFMIDSPVILFDDCDIDSDKVVTKMNNLNVTAEKPKVPKRISSCLQETNDILSVLKEEEEEEVEEETKEVETECQFETDFAKELMEDYNKKFGEIEIDN